MSDKSNESPSLPSMPEDVTKLQEALNDLNLFHKTALSATFTGAQSGNAEKLIKHLHSSYKQVLKQLEEHPYVIEMKAKMAK